MVRLSKRAWCSIFFIAFIYLLPVLLTGLEKSMIAFNETEISNVEVSNISAPAEYTYAPKGIFIYLDDSENSDNPGAISKIALKNISDDVGPIIISAHTLNLLCKVGPVSIGFSHTETIDGEKISAILNTSWIIKNISDHLYLLIPKSYLLKIGIDSALVDQYLPNAISDTELKLGLKVNHMKSSTVAEVKAKESSSFILANYFLPALYNENTRTSDTFCIRSDYQNDQNTHNIPLPLWSIYMSGHGMAKYTIILGLSIPDFKKVLDFFNTKINTRLLVYTSCYAAGQNIKEIYNDITSPIQKTYSFAIIIQGITDTSVHSMSLAREFKPFFETVTTTDLIDYKKATSHILPTLDPQDTPQIRLPGTQWFSILAAQNNVVQIGKTLAENRGTRPLDVNTYFNTTPKILLLYAQHIPFELIFQGKTMPTIISMVPGAALHRLYGISARDISPDKILDQFMTLEDLDVMKLFYIEHISGTLIKNVIVNCNDHFAYYQKGEQLYVYEYKKQAREVEENTYSTYNPTQKYSQEDYLSYLFKVKLISKFSPATKPKIKLTSPQFPQEISWELLSKIDDAVMAADLNKFQELAQRVDINAAEFLTTAIREALRTKDKERWIIIITWLLDNGANVNYIAPKDSFTSGRSPLYYALREPDIVRLLIQRGANVNATTHDGTSILEAALLLSQLESAKLLIDHGARIDENIRSKFAEELKEIEGAGKL